MTWPISETAQVCRADARYGSLRSERNHPSTGGGWVSVDEGVQTGTCRWSELPSRRSGNFKRPHLAKASSALSKNGQAFLTCRTDARKPNARSGLRLFVLAIIQGWRAEIRVSLQASLARSCCWKARRAGARLASVVTRSDSAIQIRVLLLGATLCPEHLRQ